MENINKGMLHRAFSFFLFNSKGCATCSLLMSFRIGPIKTVEIAFSPSFLLMRVEPCAENSSCSSAHLQKLHFLTIGRILAAHILLLRRTRRNWKWKIRSVCAVQRSAS